MQIEKNDEERKQINMEQKTLGAILSPSDVRDYRIACATNIEFPTEFELEMPEVKNQGTVGSCVAHAISTVIEYFSRLQGDENSEMSVGYIYGNRTNTTHTGFGMIVKNALAATCEYGDVIKKVFPYNEEVPTIIEKFNSNLVSIFPKGYAHRFSSYYRCSTETEIKTSLMKKTPVIMAMKWYDDIEVVDGVMQTKAQTATGAHCMVIYGWNQQGWKVQNSWGTKWGNKGRAILPYSTPLSETWGVVDEISENQTKLRIIELEKANMELLANANLTADAQDIIKKQTEEIQKLKTELVELKKPYNSDVGRIIAKILNFIIHIIKNKRQEKAEVK